MSDFDLDGYFARIGCGGPTDASLATLQALHAAHPRAIPFENIDALKGVSVGLDLVSLKDKVLRRACGEQREIATAAELADVLENQLAIVIPDRAAFEARPRENRIVET